MKRFLDHFERAGAFTFWNSVRDLIFSAKICYSIQANDFTGNGQFTRGFKSSSTSKPRRPPLNLQWTLSVVPMLPIVGYLVAAGDRQVIERRTRVAEHRDPDTLLPMAN